MENITFISLTPNTRCEAGHDVVYHRCLETICKQLGINFWAFTSRFATFVLPSRWSPFFRARKWRIIDCARAFFFQRFEKGEKRIFFIESFSTIDFFSLCIAGFLFAKRSDSLWVFFRYGKNQLPMKGFLHLVLTRILQFRFKERFVALTDSELIKNSFSPQLQLKVMPIPHTESFKNDDLPKDTLLFWWPGPPRASKGLNHIQDLVRLSSPAHFTLSLAKSAPLPLDTKINVHRVDDVLTREEYVKQMQRSDLILLPYDPSVYCAGTSGIFIEAVIAGKIPVVKEGSWLSHELKRYSLDALVLDWSSSTLIETLVHIQKDNEIRKLLKKMRADYLEYHCLESYQEKFKDLISQC